MSSLGAITLLLLSAVTRQGEVVVEGHKVGRVVGFEFIPELGEGGEEEKKLILRAARRALGRSAEGGKRSKQVIAGEYEGAWARGFAAYDLSAGCRKPEPWTDRGNGFMADRAGVPRFRNVILGGVIRTLKPKRVLEVGCGAGGNLLELLRMGFMPRNLKGIEIDEDRHAHACEVLPSALRLIHGDAR